MPVAMPGMIARPPTPFRPELLGRSGAASNAAQVAPTIRYVRKTGSDSNGGTSPADAWLTIGKALTTVGSNTTVYVGAGTYRETVTVTITPTSEVKIVGDTGGWFTGDPGMVQWTAYTVNDRTAVTSSTLTLNGKSNLTFQNIFFVMGTNLQLCDATALGSQNITFTDCAFQATGVGSSTWLFNHATTPGTPSHILFDRCHFYGSQGDAIRVQGNRAATDYDVDVLARNCVFYGNTPRLTLFSGGAGAGKAGGLRAQNCTSFSGSNFILVNDANCSTSIPCTATGCLLLHGSTAVIFSANTSGQIAEDYNLLWSSAPRTNTPAGSHTIATNNIANLFHFGQERIWGAMLRPFGEPMAGSPFVDFGGLDTSAGLVDLRGGPRPSAVSTWDVGAIQRGNNFGRETVTTNAGGVADSVTGDGFQDYDVAVDAGAITISVYCDYDSSYAGPLPRLMILANGELGIGQTEINFTTTSLNAFAQATITVNPTASGIITVRFISGDTSGVSKVAFDTVAFA